MLLPLLLPLLQGETSSPWVQAGFDNHTAEGVLSILEGEWAREAADRPGSIEEAVEQQVQLFTVPTVLYCHIVLNVFVNQNPLREGCAATAAASHSGHLPLQILTLFKIFVFYNSTKQYCTVVLYCSTVLMKYPLLK